MLFFLFRKSYIFWLFLFSKKFIISHEKVEKQAPPKTYMHSGSHLLLASLLQQKNYVHSPGLIDIAM